MYYTSFYKFIFDNPEGQIPIWATYLYTRAMYNIILGYTVHVTLVSRHALRI